MVSTHHLQPQGRGFRATKGEIAPTKGGQRGIKGEGKKYRKVLLVADLLMMFLRMISTRIMMTTFISLFLFILVFASIFMPMFVFLMLFVLLLVLIFVLFMLLILVFRLTFRFSSYSWDAFLRL